jgi:hypothetical protein
MNAGLPPLRKIVGTRQVPVGDPGSGFRSTMTVEVLSCGHEQPVKRDAFGRYYAERRRCRKCSRPDAGEGGRPTRGEPGCVTR